MVGQTDPCAVAPAYCWLPFTQFLPECQPIDPVACQKAGFGPALTPESRAAALKKGDELQAAYLQMNPDMAAAWDQWLNWKPFFNFQGAPPVFASSDVWLYVGIAAAGVGLLMLLPRR
jgi:hypothetical protein